MLKAFRTRGRGGEDAVFAAAEAAAGTARGSNVSNVQRVFRDADEDLACELVTALCEHVGDRGVGHSKEDDIAGDRLVRVVAVEHFDGVATLGDDGGDGLAHVAGTNDRDV